MMTVVFVCTGNTCRSPMAQVLFERAVAEQEGGIRVQSAGTHAYSGDNAAAFAAEVMADYGLSLEQHRSRRLWPQTVDEADLLLAMTEAHKEFIVQQHPDAAHKTFTLKQFVGESGDVSDPFGGSRADYEKTAEELQRLVQLAAARVLERDKDARAGG